MYVQAQIKYFLKKDKKGKNTPGWNACMSLAKRLPSSKLAALQGGFLSFLFHNNTTLQGGNFYIFCDVFL